MTIRPVGAGASVRLTGTATTSSAFNVQSTVMRLLQKEQVLMLQLELNL